MYKAYYSTIIVIMVGAIAASFLMLPNNREVALMKLHDKYYEEAFERYKVLYEKGDKSINVVIPLSRLYLQVGDVDNASILLQEFVERNPKSLEAYEQLATLYQYAQQPDEYIKVLETQHKLNPSANLLKQLSDIYNYSSRHEEQIETLEELINTYPKETTEKNYRDLAYLYAGEEKIDKAARLLENYIDNKYEHVSENILSLTIALLLDTKKSKQALQHAKYYLKHNNKVKAAISLAQQFHSKDYLMEAYLILKPYRHLALINSELFIELTAIKVDLGWKEEVKAELASYLPTGLLSKKSIQTLIEVAIELEDEDLLEKLERIYPDDMHLKKEFAAMLFYRGEYKKARQLYDNYLCNHEGDYRSHFNYAQLLTLVQQESAAKYHFNQAHSLLKNITSKTIEDYIVEAHLLLQKNALKESIALFERLVKQQPKNIDLRLDLADILIEIGYYDKAERILSKAN